MDKKLLNSGNFKLVLSEPVGLCAVFSAAPIFLLPRQLWCSRSSVCHAPLKSSRKQVDREVVVVVAHNLFILLSPDTDANLLNDPHTFHYLDYFVIGGIRTCLGVSNDPMFLWIFSNSCPLNLLLVRSHQAEIIIVKLLIQGSNNVTRVWVEPRSFDQGRHKNDAFTHSAPLLTRSSYLVPVASLRGGLGGGPLIFGVTPFRVFFFF